MEIYLPIAEISQNIFFLLSIGFVAGVLSGMFGVGGGFLSTPILILSGVPPAVAVGSEALMSVTTGDANIVAGYQAGNDITTSEANICIQSSPFSAVSNSVIAFIENQLNNRPRKSS